MDGITSENTELSFLPSQEGDQILTSEESIQLWINTLEEKDFSKTTSETSSPSRKTSFESDVFLQLPDLTNSDDLVLGAEAKHYGHFSPSLSPVVSFEKSEIDAGEYYETRGHSADKPSTTILNFEQDDKIQGMHDWKQFLKNQKNLTASDSSIVAIQSDNIEAVRESTNRKRSNSLNSQGTFNSFASSFDKPSSLAALLQPDPEELLYSLGFGSESSLLQCIPERFFLNTSEARGIDVHEIHNLLLLEDQKFEGGFYPSQCSSDTNLLNLGDSSVDSILSAESPNVLTLDAKARRILFKSSHNNIPSIHLTHEEDRLSSPTSISMSSSGCVKLETLKEVPEPSSRASSIEDNFIQIPQDSRVYEEHHQNIKTTAKNLLEAEHLEVERKPGIQLKCKRTLSDKSISSIITVIEKESNDKKGTMEARCYKFIPVDSNAKDTNEVSSTTVNDKRKRFSSVKNKQSINEFDGNLAFSDPTDEKQDPSQLRNSFDIEDVRKASLNESFQDFFRSLSPKVALQESETCSNPTPPIREDELTSNNDTDIRVTNDNKRLSDEEDKKLNDQKRFFSSAFDSIAHVFSKHQNSKIPCNGNIETEINKTNTISKSKTNSSSFFRLFNHQTLPIHSNSAFSSFVLSNGMEVELDEATKKVCHNENENTSSNQTNDNVPISSSEAQKKPLLEKEFRQHQSNVECPLGKEISLSDEHCYLKNDNKEAEVTLPSTSLSRCNNESLQLDHFNRLFQQIGSIRNDVKHGFKMAADREERLIANFEEQIVELKTMLSRDYMGWVAKEIQQLKIKLKEKDDEIRRLRDLLSSTDGANLALRNDMFSTPV